MFTTVFDLGLVGYQQSEVFVTGTANAYAPTAPLTADGKWKVAPIAPQPYKTRAVVYRPVDPARFNGTVFVEWLNVSGGLDAGPGWTAAHNELIRRGFAWVGVSAQDVGLNAAKAGNPARYSTLHHPGDSYSYDIFTQVGQAVRDQAATVLGGLHPHIVLASGESQSAFRLTTYINAVQPLVHAYDGFLVHSRFGTGSMLSQSPLANVNVPSPTFTRRDLDVPVLVVQMETDLASGSFDARQADSSRYRLWEVAGTAHADTYTLGIGFSDTGDGEGAKKMFQSMRTPPRQAAIFLCDSPINTGPQHWVVENAAYRLNLWVKQGTPPPIAPRLRVASTSPFTFALDANGNVRGGIRTPQVDVPIATLSGLGQSGDELLRPLRHDRSVLGREVGRALPDARQVHARVEARDRRRGQGRVHLARGRTRAQGRRGHLDRPELTLEGPRSDRLAEGEVREAEEIAPVAQVLGSVCVGPAANPRCRLVVAVLHEPILPVGEVAELELLPFAARRRPQVGHTEADGDHEVDEVGQRGKLGRQQSDGRGVLFRRRCLPESGAEEQSTTRLHQRQQRAQRVFLGAEDVVGADADHDVCPIDLGVGKLRTEGSARVDAVRGGVPLRALQECAVGVDAPSVSGRCCGDDSEQQLAPTAPDVDHRLRRGLGQARCDRVGQLVRHRCVEIEPAVVTRRRC